MAEAQALAVLYGAGFAGPYACALVTGTGLGGVAAGIVDAVALDYREIPGFPGAGVSGHRGRLHRGRIAGRPVLVLEGRAHAYERGDPAAMRVPLACARALGARRLLLTNASGSLRPETGPGSLVMLTDHINLSGLNPLIGEASDARFVPMTDAYDPSLRARLGEAAASCGLSLGEGVYAWFSGPSFETPAEVRMAGCLGADLVGMSTVPEVILARRHGIRVAALSVITNMGAGLLGGAPSHGETRDMAGTAMTGLRRLLRSVMAEL